MLKYFKIVFLLFVFLQAKAQNNIPSVVKCKLTLKDSSIQNYHSELCYIQIDEGAQEIRLVIDFSKFKTDHDSVDEWLHKVEKKILKFKGHFPIECLTSLSNYAPKEIISSGELYVNHTHHPFNIKITLVNTESSLYNNTSSSSSVGTIKVSFSFEVEPNKYKVNFKHHAITHPISLSVSNGYVNKYISGHENIFDLHH